MVLESIYTFQDTKIIPTQIFSHFYSTILLRKKANKLEIILDLEGVSLRVCTSMCYLVTQTVAFDFANMRKLAPSWITADFLLKGFKGGLCTIN